MKNGGLDGGALFFSPSNAGGHYGHPTLKPIISVCCTESLDKEFSSLFKCWPVHNMIMIIAFISFTRYLEKQTSLTPPLF